MYTVVVCSECKFVWIVKDSPKRSKCRKCGKNRQFEKLKKYYRGVDLEATKLARAHAQAKINDQEDHFERALERGVLEAEIDEAVPTDQLLQEKGLDAANIKSRAEEKLRRPSEKDAQHQTVRKALRSPSVTGLSSFQSYIERFEISELQALRILESLVRSEESDSASIVELKEVRKAIDERTDDPDLEESVGRCSGEPDPNEAEVESVPTSRRGIIDGATQNNDSLEEMLVEVQEFGVDPVKALAEIGKMVASGHLTKISMADVEASADTILQGELDQETREGDSNSETSEMDGKGNPPSDSSSDESVNRTSSTKEVLRDAIEELDTPTETDIIDYAVERGISTSKASRYLEKMKHGGLLMKRRDGTYRQV